MQLNTSTEQDYYSNKEYISNSQLGWLDVSPKFFRKSIDGELEKKQSLSFENGRLVHLAMLEPSKFVVSDVEAIGGMLGKYIENYAKTGSHDDAYKFSGFKISAEKVKEKFNEANSQAYCNFLKMSEGKIALTPAQKRDIDGAIYSLCTTPHVSELFDDNTLQLFNWTTYNEYDIYWEFDGVKMKSKLDRIIIDHDYKTIKIVDLKTTSSSPYGDIFQVGNTGVAKLDLKGTGFLYSFISYSYYRQLNVYYNALKWLINNDLNWAKYNDYKISCYIVPVQLGNLYECCAYKISDSMNKYGYSDFTRLIEIYKAHKAADYWDNPIQFYKVGPIVI